MNLPLNHLCSIFSGRIGWEESWVFSLTYAVFLWFTEFKKLRQCAFLSAQKQAGAIQLAGLPAPGLGQAASWGHPDLGRGVGRQSQRRVSWGGLQKCFLSFSSFLVGKLLIVLALKLFIDKKLNGLVNESFVHVSHLVSLPSKGEQRNSYTELPPQENGASETETKEGASEHAHHGPSMSEYRIDFFSSKKLESQVQCSPTHLL